MAKKKFKRHEIVTALLSVITNKLSELLPEEGYEDEMIGEAFGIMKAECRHIDVATHLKKGVKA